MSNKAPFSINFLGIRRLFAALSIILVLGSIGLLATQGLNLGMDFTGGTAVVAKGENEVIIDDVRSALEGTPFEEATVVRYGSPRDISIRVPTLNDMPADQVGPRLTEVVESKLPGLTVQQVEFVGPQVGDELRDESGLALLMALGLMLVYVWFRFTNKFGVATVVALLHDVIIVLGLFSLMRWTFDLTVLAAVLALIGYSLNDSIVVADRIRENFRDTRETDPEKIINGSLNETLSRTINTSFTTLLVLVALFFFGGEVMRAFSEALLVGIAVGTYSSIYVVTNMLFLMKVDKQDFIIPEKKEVDDMP
ncbi:Preprotein translocase SecF subunit [Alloalcanivorax dieselolei B5]|uniref:Protein-export membrane protein SecF n=1 Tax=Alcanivorax dieselolei (strain DSM 16502 / CGMCC 1.3690 / MCCC 1A00001 / B-5) TaxID=930169 RepID=K0CH48_ALCDB|nr:protein translocase subunit SecF [Alloalcanivorax dieselolei]AFT71938.1 Preprotein translocase SecF subunit [Alloalcanivorax dieselolei B5]GGK08603.1 protein translocase subunit SecF [Alloalcanivorax dieselolei]